MGATCGTIEAVADLSGLVLGVRCGCIHAVVVVVCKHLNQKSTGRACSIAGWYLTGASYSLGALGAAGSIFSIRAIANLADSVFCIALFVVDAIAIIVKKRLKLASTRGADGIARF